MPEVVAMRSVGTQVSLDRELVHPYEVVIAAEQATTPRSIIIW